MGYTIECCQRFRFMRFLSIAVGLAAALGCTDDGSKTGTGGMGARDAGLTGGEAGATSGDGGKQSTGGRANSSGGDTTTGGRPGGSGATAGGGATSSGGTTPSGRGGSAATGQPVGAICVNDANCNQSQGMAVCCAIPTCTGPCECRLAANCPKSGLFLECKGAADCSSFGGGKVCCQAGSGSQAMQYCTKPSGCPGVVLP